MDGWLGSAPDRCAGLHGVGMACWQAPTVAFVGASGVGAKSTAHGTLGEIPWAVVLKRCRLLWRALKRRFDRMRLAARWAYWP